MLLLQLDNFLHMSSTSTATAGMREVALGFRSVDFADQIELSISRSQRILPRSELNISS